MKALSRKCLTTHPIRIVRALRYPTSRSLAVHQALVPTFGRMMIGAGNLYSFGLGVLHGSGSLSVITVHIVTHAS